MKTFPQSRVSRGIVTMLLAGLFYSNSISAGELNGTEWKVTSGDTLYAIARAIYPGDNRKQARLRQDITKLNPSVFAGGANNMSVGIVLKLPGYVSTKSVATDSAPTVVTAPGSDVTQSVPSRVSGSTTSQVETSSTPGSSSRSKPTSRSAEWQVRSGDTLYHICRTIYPNDARMMAQLGRDIRTLNPSVFAEGAANMKAGVVLRLPDYVDPQSIPSIPAKPVAPAIPAEVAPAKTTTEPEHVPVTEPVKDMPERMRVIQTQPEKPVKEEKSDTPSRVMGGAVISLGFSQGGDRLVDVSNGSDIYGGTGLQFRLGYEQMYQHGHGYRASLGFQYYTLLEQRDVSYKDAYFQLAYQYRLNPFVYGIGVVLDTGAKLETSNVVEFDSAVGGTVYLEYVGSDMLNGWGLSATSLSIKEKITGTSFDANRGEIYYRWRF